MADKKKPRLNKERGEVPLTIRGETFVLCATLGALAEWTTRVGISDINVLRDRLASLDPSVILAGLESMCVSGNEGEISEVVRVPDFGTVSEAIAAALMATGDADRPPEEAAGPG